MKTINPKDDLRREYSGDLIKSGTRGKYAKQFRENSNVAILSPEVRQLFPNSQAVNAALMNYAREHHLS